jgi:hypothetical protein
MTLGKVRRRFVAGLAIGLAAVLLSAWSLTASTPQILTFEHFLQGAWLALLGFASWVVQKFAKLLPSMADAIWGPEDYRGERQGGALDKLNTLVDEVAAVKEVASQAADGVSALRKEMNPRSPVQRTRKGDMDHG